MVVCMIFAAASGSSPRGSPRAARNPTTGITTIRARGPAPGPGRALVVRLGQEPIHRLGPRALRRVRPGPRNSLMADLLQSLLHP